MLQVTNIRYILKGFTNRKSEEIYFFACANIYYFPTMFSEVLENTTFGKDFFHFI